MKLTTAALLPPPPEPSEQTGAREMGAGLSAAAPPTPPPPFLVVATAELPTDDQTGIMLIGLSISILWAANLIYTHAEPQIWYDVQERWVLGLCFAAYIVAWVPVWLLPFDLVGMEERHSHRWRCSELGVSWLALGWWAVYTVNLASGYLTYDFARSYLDAGGFTFRRRLHLAWVDIRNWYGYGPCAAVTTSMAACLTSHLSPLATRQPPLTRRISGLPPPSGSATFLSECRRGARLLYGPGAISIFHRLPRRNDLT